MISFPPAQRRFDFDGTVKVRVPLVDVSTAKAVLRENEDEVLGLILEGAIRWAFDLRGADSDRAFIRIYLRSLEEKQRGIRNNDPDSALDNVIEEIFPRSRPSWRATEIARLWNCGPDHIHDLIKAQLLQTFPRTYEINESPLVLRESAAQFLKSRVL